MALVPLFLVLPVACQEREYFYHRYWDCHFNQTWDSTSVAKALIGKWKLIYVSSYADPSLTYEGDKNQVVEFQKDSVFVRINGRIIEQGAWSVGIEDQSLHDPDFIAYGVNTQPFISLLKGRLLICEDKLMINNSYIDGADGYFDRVYP